MGRYDTYKERVLRTSKKLSEYGYFGSKSGSGGNVSLLADAGDAVVVTPTSLPYAAMTAEDICVIDLELNPIEAKRKPSIETPMHIAAYKARKDIGAVIHTHQTYASTLSIINEPIPPLFDEVTLAIGNIVEVVPYAISGSRELHDAVARRLANRCHCYIIQNHGALCVGADLDTTFTYVELLEKIADIYTHALASGKPVSTLPEATVAQLFAQLVARQDREIARKQSASSAKTTAHESRWGNARRARSRR